MTIDDNNSIAAPQRAPAAANARPDTDRQEIRHLAEQFEAMLLTQMLREMRRSMLDDEDEQGGLGANAMFDSADIEFGHAMSQNGGLGLADDMLAVFERQVAALSSRAGAHGAPGEGSVTGATAAEVPTGTEESQVAPAALVSSASVMSLAPVSSAFGWRRDPLSGEARFHSGVDLAVAYGRPVKAAAEGVVAFAGTQSGYGRTVVIDHGAGRQTRYAHLSEPLVQVGEAVTEGQIVGKSGNSGRTTGPHLHFEMLVNGHSVDPRGQP